MSEEDIPRAVPLAPGGGGGPGRFALGPERAVYTPGPVEVARDIQVVRVPLTVDVLQEILSELRAIRLLFEERLR